jgi:hypothetical protein
MKREPTAYGITPNIPSSTLSKPARSVAMSESVQAKGRSGMRIVHAIALPYRSTLSLAVEDDEDVEQAAVVVVVLP